MTPPVAPVDTPRQLFRGLLALAVGLVLGAAVVAWGVRGIRSSGNEVTVTGSARRPIRADYATWRLTVSAQSAELTDAYANVERQAARVRGFLAAQHVADSLITMRPLETAPLNETTQSGGETGRVVGYRLTRTFDVHSSDLDAITRLAARSGDLVTEGVPVVAAAPEYLYTRLADVRAAMLAEATRDAKARAGEIARSVDAAIGDVRNVRVGVFQITPRNSTEVSDYGINDVTAIEKDITAVVRVTFALR